MLHSGASLLLYEGEHIRLGHVAEAVRLMNGVTIWPDENLVNTLMTTHDDFFRI
jgi:hypothetical protein